MNLFLLVTLFFSVILSSHGVSWTEEDAIYIEDGGLIQKAIPEPSISPQKTKGNLTDDNLHTNGSTTANPDGDLGGQIAIPVEIVPGHCVKFSQCFPLLFFPQENKIEPRVTNNRNLYEFILSTSDSCEPSDLPVGRSSLENSDDIYIWCHERTYSPRPSQLPRVPLIDIKSETGESEGSCGPVKASLLETYNPVETTSSSSTDEDEDTLKGRVVGGEEASLAEFPWMVALTNRGRVVCGGSLLDETHVLIAAHCISHLRPRHLSRLKVLVGDHDIKDPTDIEHQERNVSAIIFHKEFNSKTIHSDIGLLVLSEPVQYADNVAPICLYDGSTPYEDGNTYALLAGWGKTGEFLPASSTLLKTSLKIWPQDECKEKYKGTIADGILKPNMLCAGGGGGSTEDTIVKDACRGDSGGPLMLIKDNRAEQLAIVSWGIGCGKFPGVFTRVPSFIDWIKKHRSLSQRYFVK